jgi:hypothetical protein
VEFAEKNVPAPDKLDSYLNVVYFICILRYSLLHTSFRFQSEDNIYFKAVQ